jgi:hypothetical protein
MMASSLGGKSCWQVAVCRKNPESREKEQGLTIAEATSTASLALSKGDRCGRASEKLRDD